MTNVIGFPGARSRVAASKMDTGAMQLSARLRPEARRFAASFMISQEIVKLEKYIDQFEYNLTLLPTSTDKELLQKSIHFVRLAIQDISASVMGAGATAAKRCAALILEETTTLTSD